MNEIFPGLFETDGEFPFSGNEFQTRAFLLVRPEGNLWVYGSGKIETHAEFIRANRGISKQFLSHEHEAGGHCDRVREQFDAPLVCPEPDRANIETKCLVNETFQEDGELETGFEAIMTPGHTPGSACFLWRTLHGNVLFTGDNLTPDKNGEWREFLLRNDRLAREQTISSLGKIRDIDPDLLIPSGSSDGNSHRTVTAEQWHAIVDSCVERLSATLNRSSTVAARAD